MLRDIQLTVAFCLILLAASYHWINHSWILCLNDYSMSHGYNHRSGRIITRPRYNQWVGTFCLHPSLYLLVS